MVVMQLVNGPRTRSQMIEVGDVTHWSPGFRPIAERKVETPQGKHDGFQCQFTLVVTKGLVTEGDYGTEKIILETTSLFPGIAINRACVYVSVVAVVPSLDRLLERIFWIKEEILC